MAQISQRSAFVFLISSKFVSQSNGNKVLVSIYCFSFLKSGFSHEPHYCNDKPLALCVCVHKYVQVLPYNAEMYQACSRVT